MVHMDSCSAATVIQLEQTQTFLFPVTFSSPYGGIPGCNISSAILVGDATQSWLRIVILFLSLFLKIGTTNRVCKSEATFPDVIAMLHRHVNQDRPTASRGLMKRQTSTMSTAFYSKEVKLEDLSDRFLWLTFPANPYHPFGSILGLSGILYYLNQPGDQLKA